MLSTTEHKYTDKTRNTPIQSSLKAGKQAMQCGCKVGAVLVAGIAIGAKPRYPVKVKVCRATQSECTYAVLPESAMACVTWTWNRLVSTRIWYLPAVPGAIKTGGVAIVVFRIIFSFCGRRYFLGRHDDVAANRRAAHRHDAEKLKKQLKDIQDGGKPVLTMQQIHVRHHLTFHFNASDQHCPSHRSRPAGSTLVSSTRDFVDTL